VTTFHTAFEGELDGHFKRVAANRFASRQQEGAKRQTVDAATGVPLEGSLVAHNIISD